ncbi:efflux RND transporter permease subunit [Prevotella communis]|uniref:efflux RND transporter permease subunit n=1 Tax=Prevotella communis TaxID=2913614 RepID=UPI001EDC4336|nr:efflux RND transporter permease subunit [Prevotella communis]UKK57283.1 efflux RND transporter permease subunit [Prevotella communis]
MKKLLHRPIAVTMCLIALVVMGCLALRYIPVSLMPDIDVPQITVQANMPGYSAREIDRDVISPLRGQLMQVAGVKDIRSESRMDAGYVVMTFEPGSNIDLLFIEVNEKIDRTMNTMPKDMERPKVIKASAMDIPAFYLDVWLKNETNDLAFAQLGRFAKGVVSKRIEQLPQTAMVDISGTVGTEITCLPYYDKLQTLGLTTHDIEAAIQRNNITLEALSVVDGLYRYNIHFDSQLLTKDDVANIYINHDGRLLQLKDLCRIEERVAQRNGIDRHGKHNAVTMAIIKQNDAQMADLQQSMEGLLENMRSEYPEIEFELTRDQTYLLTYTISNLKANLYVGVLLACLILFLFMRQWRLSLLIVMTIPLSLILTLLCFYLLGISMNIISLSGLILGVGMIVDNSIIVIDNVMRRWREGDRLQTAIVKGTKEVFAPMLSSVLTTCSVFIPLIFLSGVAGTLFYDQAMGVTIALFASLAVATLVIPVYFHLLFRKKQQAPVMTNKSTVLYQSYEKVMRWVFRHARICLLVLACMVPLTGIIFWQIEKERMPNVEQNDMLMTIEWNMGISATENDRRVMELMESLGDEVETSTSMAGTQEFLLSHTKDITASEAIVYVKAKSVEGLKQIKEKVVAALQQKYPTASVAFGESGNLYNMIFATDEADLEIHLQDLDGRRPGIASARQFTDSLRARFPGISVMPVVTETNIRYVADMEQMAVYKVGYDQLYARLKEQMSRNRIFEINDGAQSVPVMVGTDDKESSRILNSTVKNSEGTDVPISYLVRETKGEDYKRLPAGNGGEFYSIDLNATDKEVEQVMDYVEDQVHQPKSELSASFAGGYFTSRQLIGELALVLSVALALLYFILAAQFESFIQPLIILLEMVVDVFFVVAALWLLGESVNVMSMIGIVVMSGIIINDSILKIDTINRLRRGGMSLLRAIMMAGHNRLKPIIMTSLTTMLAILPFLHRGDMGSALQYPLSLTIIVGMGIGTMVSLFIVPLFYYLIYKNRKA